MKSSVKSKIIILIALGILFALSSMITVNLSFIAGNNNKSSKDSDDNNLDKENLKLSKISERIHIINNSGWVAFKNAGNCTGEGTYSDPYVIEDLVIDGGGSESCIWIENSSVYFRIESCSVSYSLIGIRLSNVNNSLIITNNCSSNAYLIYLSECNNNTISGNTASNNDYGICLRGNNNTISGNTANNNSESGIYLHIGVYNTISGNTANYNYHGIGLYNSYNNTISGNTASNNEYGIYSYLSDYNIISGNTANDNRYGLYLCESDYNIISGNTLLGNDECIVEDTCEGNVFENNDCGEGDGISYELIILISVIIGAALVSVVTISLIRHKRKRIQ